MRKNFYLEYDSQLKSDPHTKLEKELKFPDITKD
jgi:hypothetical protein